MNSQVAFARIGKGIGGLMPTHGLQRVAQCRTLIAIIDDDRGTALLRQTQRQSISDSGAGGGAFQYGALGCMAEGVRHGAVPRAVACHGTERAYFAMQGFYNHPDRKSVV